MGAEEIIGYVVIEGVKYIIKRKINEIGEKIYEWFADRDDDGVPDSETPEFWQTEDEYNEVENCTQLKEACDARWKELAEATYTEVPSFIKTQFELFTKNPLCVAITTCLLVVAACVVIRKIIQAVSSRGV